MSNVSVATITIRNRIRRRQLCYRDSWTRHEPAFVACSASCIVFFVPLLSTPPSILSRISTTFHLLRFLLLHRSATRCCCPYPGNLPKRAAPTYIHPRRSYIKCSRHTSFPFSHSLRVRQLPHSRTKSCCSISISHRLPKLASSTRSLRETRLHLESTLLTPPPHRIFPYFYDTVRIPGPRADYLRHHHSSLDEDDELVDTRDHLIAGRILTRYEVRTSHAPAGAKSSRCACWLGDRTDEFKRTELRSLITLSHAATLRGLQADVGDSR